MDIDNLTLGQMRDIARIVAGIDGGATTAEPKAVNTTHDPIPVVVCTDKRGVVFGYTDDVSARPITLTKARMCLYWSVDVGGVFGLGERGPSKDSKVSAVLPSVSLEGVTAIFSVDPAAERAWNGAKVQGR